MYEKVVFWHSKTVHCSGALLKNKNENAFLYFLNGYRYLKKINRFESHVLRAINSEMMKNKSTLLQIRKHENFPYLGDQWKKIHAKTFSKKYEE